MLEEIKDILAYLKTIDNSRDDIAVKRIINIPKRGIGATSIGRIDGYAQSSGSSFFDICRILKELGELRHYIKGVHLSCSLSGEYQRQSPRMIPSLENDARLLSHVCNIDQHRPFTDPAVLKIFELIEPDYVVHVLYYDDFNQLARQITEQKQLLNA